MPSYSMSKRDKTILKKILKYCEEASYAHQYFHEDKAFFYNEKEGHVYRSSVAMDIFQIGELAKSLTPETRRAYPDIPWGGIIKMREIFAHHYGDLNYDNLWDTLVNDIPVLSKLVEKILEGQNGDSQA